MSATPPVFDARYCVDTDAPLGNPSPHIPVVGAGVRWWLAAAAFLLWWALA